MKLTPIISDPEYLLDQHILICVKSTDSDESYGSRHTHTHTHAHLSHIIGSYLAVCS